MRTLLRSAILTIVITIGAAAPALAVVNNQPVLPQTSPKKTTAPAQQKRPASAPKPKKPADCRSNIQCLIKFAQNNCRPVKVTHTFSTRHPFIESAFPGLSTVTTKTYYEIRSKQNGNCVIYEKLVSGSMKFNPAKWKDLLAKRPSLADPAKAVLDSTNQAYKKLAGKDAVCKVTAKEFKDKIGRLLKGEFSVNVTIDLATGKAKNLDPYAAKCSGKLYEL